jgi:hypothetical protein
MIKYIQSNDIFDLACAEADRLGWKNNDWFYQVCGGRLEMGNFDGRTNTVYLMETADA